MTLAHRFSVVALLLLGCSAQAQSDARLLEAIGQVESGMDRNARGKAGERGAYQMKPTSWADANAQLLCEGRPTYSWLNWRNATAQDMMASAYLRVLRKRLNSLGIPSPTPEQIALAWNRGATGAAGRNFAPNDYAVRVGNLFRLQGALTR